METRNEVFEKQKPQVDIEINTLYGVCSKCEEQLAELMSRLLNSVMRDEPQCDQIVGDPQAKPIVSVASRIRECRWIVQSMEEKISTALDRLEV